MLLKWGEGGSWADKADNLWKMNSSILKIFAAESFFDIIPFLHPVFIRLSLKSPYFSLNLLKLP